MLAAKQKKEKEKMSLFHRAVRPVFAVTILLILYFLIFHYYPRKFNTEVSEAAPQLRSAIYPPALSHSTCQCSEGSVLLKDYIPKEQYEELVKRRTQEFSKHKARTTSVLSRLLVALPNSPLQYPFQGFTVRPLTATLIPGLGLYAGKRSSYKVSLNVTKGVLTTTDPAEGVTVEGNGERVLTMESSSLVQLNKLLAHVSYTSNMYHIHTGDLVSFQFEQHEAVFTIVIQQPRLPVLYDMGTEVSAHVTITVKTFLRYKQLNVLLNSIRRFYSNIKVIIADDSFKPQNVTGDNIQHYIMPPAQGWFAGRNLAVSQVTTKYFLWVDDDFEFTENTKIEKLVEVMEANPELDVVGGSVQGNQFYFSLHYDEGDKDGGCLDLKLNEKFHSLPAYPNCFLVSGVVNFFLARTDSARRVGFEPKLQRLAHPEFFMDGLGSLLVATCQHVTINHQVPKKDDISKQYSQFRHPPKNDEPFKQQLLFFKNNLKCFFRN